MQIFVVDTIQKGLERAKEYLYDIVDNHTVLFLSGGSTPKPLYETLAQEGIIKPAAIAQIDERYVATENKNSSSDNSNETMIANTDLLRYCKARDIPFFPMLQPEFSQEQAARAYDEKVRDLFFHFRKSVGILGIGKDGHTAGIPTDKKRAVSDSVYHTYDFVTSYSDSSNTYGKRITLTFAGLTLLDHIIIIAFGKDKKKALQEMFTTGPIEDLPARFYTQPDIAKKTIIITDQAV